MSHRLPSDTNAFQGVLEAAYLRGLPAGRQLVLGTLAFQFEDARFQLTNTCVSQGIGMYDIAVLRRMFTTVWLCECRCGDLHCSKFARISSIGS